MFAYNNHNNNNNNNKPKRPNNNNIDSCVHKEDLKHSSPTMLPGASPVGSRRQRCIRSLYQCTCSVFRRGPVKGKSDDPVLFLYSCCYVMCSSSLCVVMHVLFVICVLLEYHGWRWYRSPLARQIIVLTYVVLFK